MGLVGMACRRRNVHELLRRAAVEQGPQQLQLTNGQFYLGVEKKWSIADLRGGDNPSFMRGLAQPEKYCFR